MKLKVNNNTEYMAVCRSREGAWIEIQNSATDAARMAGRSREGAWIEISVMLKAPATS